MELILTIKVPSSADQAEALAHLHQAHAAGEGITIVTPRRRYLVDVDVTDIERVDA